MSTRASPVTATAVLVAALVFGFGGGAIVGSLGGGTGAAASPPTTSSSAAPTETPPANSISLSAEQTSVSPSEQIDMTGQLEPPVGGVELIVERSLDGGEWGAFPDADDPVTVTTDDNGTFSTYVVTGRTGQNRFRVVGQVGDEPLESEPVTVTIG
ncbi:MAG TPA: hypothetical protein VFI46_03960 [Jiangellaceae bacterium]|nr:hypothetical protein [Jiangellaceae bacterium]